jgi:microsomal dipeptidase-like Zn-dependent dipeptidase
MINFYSKIRVLGLVSFILTHHLSTCYSQQNNQPLQGFVDMHTHPRNDLAFGTELFYGCPYGDINVSLKNCNSSHGGYGMFDNPQGNVFRNQLVEQGESCGHAEHDRTGFPSFTYWPSWCSIFHQQMWMDWIERAHQGGLNIMVALATHSHCMADAAETSGTYDDLTVMNNSIEGIKEMVRQSSFMEIALSSKDVRRIVNSGKLAVIIGIEMDNIGNFYSPIYPQKATYHPNPTEKDVKNEIDRIWDLGVRYILPIHVTNNIFGGAAIYEPAFNISNKYNTGNEFIPEEIKTSESGIGFYLEHPVIKTNPESNFMAKVVFDLVGGILPDEVNPSRKENYTYWPKKDGYGHRNSLGLTTMGKKVISYLMHKGFLIDIDHMSEKSVKEVLELALINDYPVNSGHNELRGKTGNENNRTVGQYQAISKLGGMVGLGHGEVATRFLERFRDIAPIMGNKNIAIGTDVNGFFPLPYPDTSITVVYNEGFIKCTTGNRTWDINTDGFAHYGLFPDYIKSWEALGMSAAEKKIFMSSAEYFTLMWEKCEEKKPHVSGW